jgi:hypothetical protein
MNWLRILLYGGLILVAILVILWVTAATTGHDRRGYAVLLPQKVIEVGGQQVSVADLALAYQPKMHLRNANPSPPLLKVWYEAVSTDQNVDLVYYHVWENEIHPNLAYDRLYAFFRSAYYGYPLYDIEYFQVSVSRTTGEVVGLLFETSPGDDYYVTISEHIVSRFSLRPDGLYDEVRSNRSGTELSRSEQITALFDGQRTLLLAQTWNHLTRLLGENDSDYRFLDAPLEPLSSDDYAKYKFVRKSQGDHKTAENRWMLPLAFVVATTFVTLPVSLLYKLRRRKSPAPKK